MKPDAIIREALALRTLAVAYAAAQREWRQYWLPYLAAHGKRDENGVLIGYENRKATTLRLRKERCEQALLTAARALKEPSPPTAEKEKEEQP